MKLEGKQLIGQGTSCEGKVSFQATNPATGEKLPGTFHHATAGELQRATELADKAYEILVTLKAEQKAAFLDRIATEIMGCGDALLERCNQETGLPLARLQGERGRTCGQLTMFANLVREGSWVDARIETAAPDRKPAPKPDLRLMRRSLGPVAVFCASNFPLAFSVAGGDTASALAAGNPVIVKAHHAHPGTAEMVGKAVQRAAAATGMPAGVFSLLYGPGGELGTALVKHPSIKAAGFTGSQRAGRALFDAAASRPSPIPVYAEMSSINPVFVLPGALKEQAGKVCDGLCQSVMLGVGQFCTCPGVVVLLAGPDAEAFLAEAGKKLAEGAKNTMLTGDIFAAYVAGVKRFAGKKTVTIVGQKQVTPEPAGNRAAPALFRVDGKSFLADEGLRDEIFGPTTLAVVCADREQMIAVARSFRGELTGTIHGTAADLEEFRALLPILESRVGRLLVGGFPTGVEVCSAMNHGGPYPATTDVHYTSVGTGAILRFSRPICFQNMPDAHLPEELQNANPRGIWRLVDGELTKAAVR